MDGEKSEAVIVPRKPGNAGGGKGRRVLYSLEGNTCLGSESGKMCPRNSSG